MAPIMVLKHVQKTLFSLNQCSCLNIFLTSLLECGIVLYPAAHFTHELPEVGIITNIMNTQVDVPW